MPNKKVSMLNNGGKLPILEVNYVDPQLLLCKISFINKQIRQSEENWIGLNHPDKKVVVSRSRQALSRSRVACTEGVFFYLFFLHVMFHIPHVLYLVSSITTYMNIYQEKKMHIRLLKEIESG